MHEDAIIAEVARRMGVPVERVRARDRSPHVTAARHAAFWALNRSGLSPAQIARHLDLNHSTVVHGLARAEQHPEWRALVAPAIELSGAGGQRQALKSWLDRGLRSAPFLERRAIYFYITCTILGWERHPGSACAYGLWLVLCRPWYRAAVEETLRGCDLEREIGRIDLHASRLGYRAS
jgi:DNA-binding CsgD family transcriptional regulator